METVYNFDNLDLPTLLDLQIKLEKIIKEKQNPVVEKKVWKPLKDRKKEEMTESKTMMRLRSLVNKMAEDQFEKLSSLILEMNIDKKETMDGLATLLFDKMVLESLFRNLYLRLLRLIKDKSIVLESGKSFTFKQAFIDKCQKEFKNSINEGPKKERTEEQEFKRKLYVGGTCQMLGLLFKEGFLTPLLLKKYCLDELLKSAVQDCRRYSLENFCHLLKSLLTNSSFDLLDSVTKNTYKDNLLSLAPIAKETQGNRLVFIIEDIVSLLGPKIEEAKKVIIVKRAEKKDVWKPSFK